MQRANRACRTHFVAIAPCLKLNCHTCKSPHDARFATDLCVILKRAYDEPETKYTSRDDLARDVDTRAELRI